MIINITNGYGCTAKDISDMMAYVSTYIMDSHTEQEVLNECWGTLEINVWVGPGEALWQEESSDLGLASCHMAKGPKPDDGWAGIEVNDIAADVIKRRLMDPDADPYECFCTVRTWQNRGAMAPGWHHQVGCPRRPPGEYDPSAKAS
jgi:hypothetical protein